MCSLVAAMTNRPLGLTRQLATMFVFCSIDSEGTERGQAGISLRIEVADWSDANCPNYRYPVAAIRNDKARAERRRDMSKTRTTRVNVKPGDRPSRGDTDWARIDAMTDEEAMADALSENNACPNISGHYITPAAQGF
jgi:hypothetical protein